MLLVRNSHVMSTAEKLAQAFALRGADPQGMLALMETLAREVGKTPSTPSNEDERALVWGHIANARRIVNRLVSAQAALGRAWHHQAIGTGDGKVTARLYEFHASLCEATRRFPEALAAIDAALQLHPHGPDRAAPLVQKATIVGHAGDPAQAVRLLREAIEVLNPRAQPTLATIALHNLSWFLVDLNLPDHSLAFLHERQLQFPVPADDEAENLRVRWLESRILAGLGEAEAAAATMEQAVEGFITLTLFYDAALSLLDLALIRARQGQFSKVLGALSAATPIVRALGVRREEVAATLLRRVVDLEAAVTLLPQAIRALRRRGERHGGRQAGPREAA